MALSIPPLPGTSGLESPLWGEGTVLGGRRKRIGGVGAGDEGGKGHQAGNKVQEASRITTVSIFGFESQGRPSFPPTQSHVPLTRVPPLTCGCAGQSLPPLSWLVQKRLPGLEGRPGSADTQQSKCTRVDSSPSESASKDT